MVCTKNIKDIHNTIICLNNTIHIQSSGKSPRGHKPAAFIWIVHRNTWQYVSSIMQIDAFAFIYLLVRWDFWCYVNRQKLQNRRAVFSHRCKRKPGCLFSVKRTCNIGNTRPSLMHILHTHGTLEINIQLWLLRFYHCKTTRLNLWDLGVCSSRPVCVRCSCAYTQVHCLRPPPRKGIYQTVYSVGRPTHLW